MTARTTSRQNARTPAYGLWADPVLSLALLALWIALALVFNGEPWIDQRVSALFFAALPCPQGSSAIACGFFPASAEPFWQAIRNFLHYLPATARRRGGGKSGTRSRSGAPPRRRAPALQGHRRPRLSCRAGPCRECLPQAVLGSAAPGFDRSVRRRSALRAGRRLVRRLPVQLLLRLGRGRLGRSGCSALFRYGRRPAAARQPSQLRQSPASPPACRVAFGGHYLSDVVLGGLSSLVVFAALATLVEGLHRASRKP